MRHPMLKIAAILNAALSLFVSAACLAQKPPDPPAPPWKDFIKVEGHVNEIPAQWIVTPEGKFAHSIKLPSAIPKTVPFDFKTASWNPLKPRPPSVARLYWEHLCETEAGSFILTPVDKVDGFFFMRPVHGANQQENNDRWKLEAPGLEASFGFKYDPQRRAIGYVNAPWRTYEWVDFPDVDRRSVLHMSGYVSRVSPMKVEQVPDSKARYAVVWRGIRRERDREHFISGAEWIALDRHSGEVLGVLRDFYLTGETTNVRERISWLNARRCPFVNKRYGLSGETNISSFWIPEVLKPAQFPKALEAIFEANERSQKR
jgi:hypothetical protein